MKRSFVTDLETELVGMSPQTVTEPESRHCVLHYLCLNPDNACFIGRRYLWIGTSGLHIKALRWADKTGECFGIFRGQNVF